MPASESAYRVVVVGAGVSGCACAVTLAEAGLPVTLVNSALDVVGLPGYGPDLWLTDPDAWARVPRRLRDAWERWSQVPGESPAPDNLLSRDGVGPAGADAPPSAAGREPAAASPEDRQSLDEVLGSRAALRDADDPSPPVLLADRRAVSLEIKQLIELLPQIDLRQGLVVDVRPSHDETGRIEVETAFGEVVRGAACVLAVGLGLGGRVTEGGREMAGARYGEVAADALYEALRDRGVAFATVEREVGDHVVGWKPDRVPRELRLGPVQVLHLRHVVPVESSRSRTPVEGLLVPPGPHEAIGPRRSGVWSGAGNTILGGALPAEGSGIFPDEAATGEWYRSPGFVDETGLAGLHTQVGAEVSARDHAGIQVVRGAHRVRGQVIVSLDKEGRLLSQGGTWVVGQAAGACTYLQSLVDGVRGALAVVAALSAAGPQGGPA